MGESDGKLSAWLIPPEAQHDGEKQLDVEPQADGTPETSPDEAEIQAEPTRLRRLFQVSVTVLVFMICILPITYFLLALGSSGPSAVFRHLRMTAWAEVWSWATFLIWTLALATGYTFVARVTEQRRNPFKSRFDKYTCFIKLLLSAPVVYLLGPIRALYLVSHNAELTVQPHGSAAECLGYNAIFLIAFFIGIQFTYLDYIMLFRTAGDKFGTPSLWKTYTRRELTLIIPLVLSIVFIVAWHIYLIKLAELLAWYGVFYLLVAVFLVVPTVILRKKYYLHMHHYVIFGLLIPFFAFPNALSLICLGIVCGVYVEGIARWGMAWLWYPGAERQYDF